MPLLTDSLKQHELGEDRGFMPGVGDQRADVLPVEADVRRDGCQRGAAAKGARRRQPAAEAAGGGVDLLRGSTRMIQISPHSPSECDFNHDHLFRLRRGCGFFRDLPDSAELSC